MLEVLYLCQETLQLTYLYEGEMIVMDTVTCQQSRV